MTLQPYFKVESLDQIVEHLEQQAKEVSEQALAVKSQRSARAAFLRGKNEAFTMVADMLRHTTIEPKT